MPDSRLSSPLFNMPMFGASTVTMCERMSIPRSCVGYVGYVYILVRGHPLAVLLMLAPLGHTGLGAYRTLGAKPQWGGVRNGGGGGTHL